MFAGWATQLSALVGSSVLYAWLPAQAAAWLVPQLVAHGVVRRPASPVRARAYHLLAVLAVLVVLAAVQAARAVLPIVHTPSLYALVGVHGGRAAPDAAIRRRWRLLARTLHPDKLAAAPAAADAADAYFSTLTHAVQTLLDPAARDAYDRLGLIAPARTPNPAPQRADLPARLRTALADAAATYLVRLIALAPFASASASVFYPGLLSLLAFALEARLMLAPPAPHLLPTWTPFMWAQAVRAACGALLPALVQASYVCTELVRLAPADEHGHERSPPSGTSFYTFFLQAQVALARQTAALASASASVTPEAAPHTNSDVNVNVSFTPPSNAVERVSLAQAMRSTPLSFAPRAEETQQPPTAPTTPDPPPDPVSSTE